MVEFIGIIPIAGSATRMKNIPKFLLPATNNQTLLDNIISICKNNGIENLYAGLSEINSYLLKSNDNFKKLIVNTKTMAETVSLLTRDIEKDNLDIHNLILLMPDTYLKITNEINMVKEFLNQYKIVLVCWKIKDYQVGKVGQCNIINNEVVDIVDKDVNCKYPYFWGIISWNSSLNQLINPKWQTIGELVNIAIKSGIYVRAIISDSNYYDCGTFEEYFKMIKNNVK